MKKEFSYQIAFILVLLALAIILIMPAPKLIGKSTQGGAFATISIGDGQPPIWRNMTQQYNCSPQNIPNQLSIECWDNDKLGYGLLSTSINSPLGPWTNWTSGTFGSPYDFGDASMTWVQALYNWYQFLPLSTTVYWRVYCNDSSGNTVVSNISDFLICPADIQPPVIHWVDCNPDPANQGDPIDFEAYVTDDYGVDNVWFEVHSINYSYNDKILDLYFFRNYTTILPPGIFYFTVYANDSAGLTAIPVTGNCTVQVPVGPPVKKKVKKYCAADVDAPALVPIEPRRIAKLSITGRPRICIDYDICNCTEYGGWISAFEVGEFIARIDNTGLGSTGGLTFDLVVPESWQVNGPHKFRELNPGEAVEVTWKIIPKFKGNPYKDNVFVRVLSKGEVIATKQFEIEVLIPDFIETPEPRLKNYLGEDKLTIYTLVNNLHSFRDLSHLHTEFDINSCTLPHTFIADIYEIGNVTRGEVFLNTTEYDIEPLKSDVYSIHSVLYSEGYAIDESYTVLDLRPDEPIKFISSRSSIIVPQEVVEVEVKLTNTGSTLTGIVPSIEALPFHYAVEPDYVASLGIGQTQNFIFTIYPTVKEGSYAGDFKFTSKEGCVFTKGFVLGPEALAKITKLYIEGEPRICDEHKRCVCLEYGNWTRILEVGEFIARVENIGEFNEEELTFELVVPGGWQVDGPHTYSDIKPGQVLEVIWRLIPRLQLEPYSDVVIVRVRSEGDIVASMPFDVDVLVPDFVVLAEPTLESYVDKKEIPIYTLINNRYGLTQIPALHTEFDLNDCEFPHTVIVDIFEIGNVIIGEVFLDKTNYEVEPLRPRLYDVHGVLYSKGYEIDESYRLLDLRPKQPVRLVFSRILFYVIVSLVSVIIFAALLNRLRKRSEYGFRGHY